MKVCYRVALVLVALLVMMWLQAATAVEAGNADKAEADSQKSVAEQQNLLAASNRSDTRHELIIGAEKLAYTATSASLDVCKEKAEPVGRVLPIPASLEDNEQSWLAFTNLVFVDPIGTGYSLEISKKIREFKE